MSRLPAESLASEQAGPDFETPQLWCGPATPNEATIYLRYCTPRTEKSETFQATLRGPFCEWARTLPATFPFQRYSDDLWKATVVDPVFWSPDFPARYRVQWKLATLDNRSPRELQLQRPDRHVLEPRDLAIRQWGVRGEDLWLNGQRWVWRATSNPALPADQLAACHEQLLSLVLPNGRDEWLQRASVLGISVGIRPSTSSAAALRRDVLRAAQWPAVMMILLPATSDVSREELRTLAPNLLMVAETADAPTTGETLIVPSWCDALLAPDDEHQLTALRSQASAKKLPLMARRLLPGSTHLAEEARRQCERLQRDLVERFELSGYLVEYQS